MERDVIIGILLSAFGGVFIGGILGLIGFALVGFGLYYIIRSVMRGPSTRKSPKAEASTPESPKAEA
jgi:F0F1-type ATP synthase assembly protein I